MDASRYVILERVAPGDDPLGLVYRAVDRSSGREVVIRTLAPEGAPDEARRAGIGQAIQRWATLDHPRIVPVLDHGLGGGELWAPAGVPYVVTAPQPGGDLRAALRREGRLAEPAALATAAEIASALDSAHRAGVVHGGLQPRCVLLDEPGHPKVADFGLAVAAGTLPAPLEPALEATGTGPSAAGSDPTPRPSPYRAPEQPLGTLPDGRVDLWSLGILLYELLTGGLPSDGESLLSHVLLPPRQGAGGRQREVLPLFLPSTGTVLLRALTRTPQERFQSAGEMRDALLCAREAAVGAGARPAAPGETTAVLLRGAARYRVPAPPPAPPPAIPRELPIGVPASGAESAQGAESHVAPPEAPLETPRRASPPRPSSRSRGRLALLLIPMALLLLALLAFAVSPAGAPATAPALPATHDA